MSAAQILKTVSLILGAVVTVCYGYQILYMLLPFLKKQKPLPEGKYHRYAILIAARNEAAVLPYLLESIHQQDYPKELFTTYVVADNCTDGTASTAAAGGAVCMERFSRTRRGKGYALHDLINWIDQREGLESYDAFLVFDADNVLKPDYITEIDRVCSAGYDVFCGYRDSKNLTTNWVSGTSGLWFLHDSVHLNASRMLLGNPCHVTGTGFGFTRKLLDKSGGWNFFTLTEDLEFNNWCVTNGIPVGYTEKAVLFDEQPVRFSQSWRQRTRWVQGGIQVSVKYGRPLLQGILRGGKGGYACLEALSLSLWGYCLGTVSGILTLASAFCRGGWIALGQAILVALAGAIAGSLLMGGLTMLLAGKHTHATAEQKWTAVLAFPLYTLSYLPIAVTAVFRKFHWLPIEHSHTCSIRELCKNRGH